MCVHVCVHFLGPNAVITQVCSFVRKAFACLLILSLSICLFFLSYCLLLFADLSKQKAVVPKAGFTFCCMEGSRYLEERLFPSLSRVNNSPTNKGFISWIACLSFELFSSFERDDFFWFAVQFLRCVRQGMRSRKDQTKKNKSLCQCRWLPQVPIPHSVTSYRNHQKNMHASSLVSLAIVQITLQPRLESNLFVSAFAVCLLSVFLFWSSENRFFSFLSGSHALAQRCNVWVAVSTAGECSLLKINHGNISVGIRACKSLFIFQ